MFDLLKIVRAAYDSASKWVELHVRAYDDETGPLYDEDVFLLHPFGMAIVPVVTPTLKGWGWQDGYEHFVPFLRDTAHALSGLLSGETRVYSVGNIDVAISLRQDGNIVLNGGTKSVARVDDTVNASTTMALYMEALAVATGVPVPADPIGVIATGAANVKA